MKKVTVFYNLIFAVIIVFSSDCIVEAKRDPNAPQLEGALLSPVGAFGDATQYVVELSDDIMCGVSHGRLKTFSKDNVEEVLSSYWMPSRGPSVFEYYNDYIYLVRGDGIWIFDLVDPKKIRLAGKLDTYIEYGANIEIKQDKLFLVSRWPVEIVIFSLENPEEPQRIFRRPLPHAFRAPRQIRIVDNRIYVLADNGLAIYDAQDLSAPQFLGKIGIDTNFALGALIVKGNYAYIYFRDEIRIFDISVPDAIEYKTFIEARKHSHAVLRDDHFLGYGDDGVSFYDISSPLSPELVREYRNRTPGHFLIGKSQDYIVDNDGKAEPIVGLPYFSENISRFGFSAYDIVIKEQYVYAFGSGHLWLLDISKPWKPEFIRKMRLAVSSNEKVIINGDYIYTTNQIVDISQRTEPVIVKSLNVGFGECLAVKDNYLLMVRWENLEIWDIQIPSEATLLKTISFEERLNKVIVHEGIIYLGFYEGKLRSCELENDLTLTTLDQIEVRATERGFIMDLCLENDLLYVALNQDGVASVDINDPFNMQVHARFGTSQYSSRIKVFNAYAYISDGSGGIKVVDMLIKGFEKELASYPTTDWTKTIAFSGNYIYCCEFTNGIAIFRSSLLNAE